MRLKIVVFGLSMTSSWGNGHAVTYRALIKALASRGHDVTFLERDVPWYRSSRDLVEAEYCRIELYKELREIPVRFGALVAEADLVILGSFVPDGAIIGDWITSKAAGVTAFYDIDTPVTLAALNNGGIDYLTPSLIPRFNLYLSFTGGPTLELIEQLYGSPCARPLFCTADTDLHAPRDLPKDWQLGYIGTYSPDRQPALERLLIEPARQLSEARFVVAGAQFPDNLKWPDNVSRREHCAPQDHPDFYSRQKYTLNVTRADMVSAGYSASVRLFEAAACGTPIISDRWPGLDKFFLPGREILTAGSSAEITQILNGVSDERRRDIAAAARKRFLEHHTPAHRAKNIEEYYAEVKDRNPASVVAAEGVA
jgi:spore maturation protein CgeB